MKTDWKDWLFFAVIVGAIGFVIYSAYALPNSKEGAEWLAKSAAKATMKDVLGTGGILVALHALLTR
jgi:hypothetical protein